VDNSERSGEPAEEMPDPALRTFVLR